jgi:hypothetical protein
LRLQLWNNGQQRFDLILKRLENYPKQAANTVGMGQDFNYIMDQCLVSGEPFDWQYQDRAVLLVAKRAIHVDFPKKSLRKPFVTRRIGYNSLMTLKNRIVAAAAEVRKRVVVPNKYISDRPMRSNCSMSYWQKEAKSAKPSCKAVSAKRFRTFLA